MFENFENYIYDAINLHGGSLSQYIKYVSDTLFNLKTNPNNTEIIKITQKNLLPKRFYLIRYNYNGNKIWCPILALDYKIRNERNILYAVNLEYLPPKYKIKYFNLLFSKIFSEMNKIVNNNDLRQEKTLPFTFEFIYNTLKSNGNMNYALTAFDYLKIVDVYLISAKIAPEIIMCDLKRYNSKSMKELFNNIPESNEKNILKNIIEEFDKLIESYSENSIQYHKQVANFEKHLKLIK